jgi:hypothetical protein
MLTNRRICIILNAWSEFLLLAKAEEVSFLQKYEKKSLLYITRTAKIWA